MFNPPVTQAKQVTQTQQKMTHGLNKGSFKLLKSKVEKTPPKWTFFGIFCFDFLAAPKSFQNSLTSHGVKAGGIFPKKHSKGVVSPERKWKGRFPAGHTTFEF